MRFKDLMTGNVLDAENADVIAQFEKHMERYEPCSEDDTEKPGRKPKAAGQ